MFEPAAPESKLELTMQDAAHPSTYSIYWNAAELPRLRRPNALVISLALFGLTLAASATAVAGGLAQLPEPNDVVIVRADANAVNLPPVTERGEILLATPE